MNECVETQVADVWTGDGRKLLPQRRDRFLELPSKFQNCLKGPDTQSMTLKLP